MITGCFIIDTMTKAVRTAVILHFFIGAGALFGGLAAIITPDGPMGMSPDVLRLGPFDSFLIPGIILFVLIGMGNIVSGILVIRRIRNYDYLTGAMGAILIGWLVVQCVILQSVHFLHVLYFALGCLQGLIALYWLKERHAFPL